MQASVDAYADPWLEGREPATAGQFHDSLPLIPLPQVPVRGGPKKGAARATTNGAGATA